MTRVVFVTVTDRDFFPGTLATVSSILQFQPTATICVVVNPQRPLTGVQSELLTRNCRLVLVDSTDLDAPGRHHAAWELKAYAALDLSSDSDVLVGIDSDCLLCAPVDDLIERCHSTGHFLGGKDGDGELYDVRYAAYGIAAGDFNPKYMSTSLYFWPATAGNRSLLEKWAACVGSAEFNGTGPCPGHGDQGVLNAILFAARRTGEIELLDNRLFSQHWTYWDSIIDFAGGRFVNVSAGRLPQRSFHCGGAEKFWTRPHRDRVLSTNPLQTANYLWFLAMLWFGPLCRLDIDPAEWLPAESEHLVQDLVDFLPQIQQVFPPARARWNEVADPFLERLTSGVHRAMSLGGSMSELIELVASHSHIRRYVEIGSYLGGSILTLALRFLNRDIDFYSVESFQGNLDGTMDGWPLPSRLQYFANLARFPTARVRPVPGDSKRAATLFDDRSLDFIFIDACHDTPAVLADIDSWRPKLARGGILAGDDYNWDTVKAAVDARFDSVKVTPTGSVWWVEGAQGP